MEEWPIDIVKKQYFERNDCRNIKGLKSRDGMNDLDELIFLFMYSKEFRVIEINDHIQDLKMFKNFQQWCLGYNVIIEDDKYEAFFDTVFF